MGGADQIAGAVELSVIVPTFNESENVAVLVDRLRAALAVERWEVVFVDDDSPDGTAEAVRALGQGDARIRCLQRIGRRGLASACIEGLLSSSAPFLAVMDADLQHDERILPQMLAALRDPAVDIVVASRYAPGGGVSWTPRRASISGFATRIARLVAPPGLTDPMSGFFMLRRTVLMESVRRTSSIGFKVLLDLFASAPRALAFREIPYQFRARAAGESKLDAAAVWDYLMLLADKLAGSYVPVRFLSFSIIGGFGLLVHMSMLGFLLKALGQEFDLAQAGATVVAMTTNFFLNNALTYRDRRLKGWPMWRGLLLFCAACGLGAVANVGVASAIFAHRYRWWLAGIAGVAIGAVWNYAATANFVWRRK